MIRSLLVLGLLVGCGSDEGLNSFKAPSLPGSVTVDGAADYFTDRNFTGEDFQNFQSTAAGQVDDGYVDGKNGVDDGYISGKERVEAGYENADDKIAASKHKAAGYTGDRNITGDAFSTQFSDYTDKVRRKGEITKGYTSDRLDQIKDPDRKEREQIKDLQSRADASDAERLRIERESAHRMALIEAVNDLQNAMLETQSERLSVLESDASSLSSVVASNKEDQDAINEVQVLLNNLFSDTLDRLFFDLGLVQDRVADTEGNIITQSLLIADLTAKTNRLKYKLRNLKYKMRNLKGKVRDIKQDVRQLLRDMYSRYGDIADLRRSIEANEDNITILQNDVGQTCSVSTISLNVVEIPPGHNMHSSWWIGNGHSVMRTIIIPTVICPTQQPN